MERLPGVTPFVYRLVPRTLRRRIIARTPARLQRYAGLTVLRRAVRRRPCAPGTTARVRAGGRLRSRWMWAEVSDRASPLDVGQRNLERTIDVLERAGIPYLCLPAKGHRSVIVVDDVHAGEVRQVLREGPGRTGARVVPARRERGAVDVFWPVTDPRGAWVLGAQCACQIQFWRRQSDELVDPYSGETGDGLAVTVPAVMAPRWVLSGHAPTVPAGRDSARLPTHASLAVPPFDHVPFPIDVVYTWVDGSDPLWLRRKEVALSAGPPTHDLAACESRYADHDELRYSLRSLECFAPWVRNIYLVTDDQLPAWLDPAHPRVTVVSHREMFADPDALPTFNSHAIESQLHRIPGLAEQFLYFNDDMFLGQPLTPTSFFFANGIAKFFLSSARIGRAPASTMDAPVDAAGKNSRERIVERFGRSTSRKMRHVPYPLLRSVLEEIAGELAADVRDTASHRFRHPDDLSIPSSLAHYWAYLTGRAVPGRLRYLYADLAQPQAPMLLIGLLRRRQHDVFCVNDTDVTPAAAAEWAPVLSDFLAAYYPFRSSFELPEDAVAERSRISATERYTAFAGQRPARPARHLELVRQR